VERRILSVLALLDVQPAKCNSWFAETLNASHQATIMDGLIRSPSLNT
jgi:hypothetical protein